MAEANAAGSTSLPALSPPCDSIPPTSSTSLASFDRRAILTRAHLLARRFRDVMPSYAAALAYGLRVAWNDARARREHQQRFAGYVFRPQTAKERADSRYYTRRVGSSFT